MKVEIPTSFVPERTYALDVLLGDFLGLTYAIEAVDRGDTVIHVGDRRLVIRDGLFGQTDHYLDRRWIPERVTEHDGLVVLYGTAERSVTDAEIVTGNDLVAGTFFMLTRWEEGVRTERDEHARFPGSASLAVRAGFIHRPIVNEYVEWLWSALAKLGCKQPRKSRTYTVVPSHDIDWPRHWTLRTGVVTCAGDLLRRRSPALAARTARDFAATRAGLRKDPFDTYDWLMDVSEEAGWVSNFNFMTGRASPHDPPFTFSRRKLQPIVERVARRGHGVGFHPSYLAFDNATRWQAEHALLESVSPVPVRVGREHYLRFAAPITWQIWDDRNMEWDSTLGYADHEGFRCGTCYDYPVFNVTTRRTLRLRELPLTAMDSTLVRYRKLSVADTRTALAALRAQVQKYSGTFVLLWHNSNLDGEWAAYRDVYREAIGGAP